MHNHDDKYPDRPGFEPGTSRLQTSVDKTKPSGPTTKKSQVDTMVLYNSYIIYNYSLFVLPPKNIVSDLIKAWDTK